MESSNIAVNTPFYNSLGYYTVANIVVGDDNPAWKKSPVTVALVKSLLLQARVVSNIIVTDD